MNLDDYNTLLRKLKEVQYLLKTFIQEKPKESQKNNNSGTICPVCKKGEEYYDDSCCHKFNFQELKEQLFFYDYYKSVTSKFIRNELGKKIYNFTFVDFKKGDVVIDIGGNIGMTSIYLLKKYPFIKIIAFEPIKSNYRNFIRNIVINKIPPGTIYVENKAVSGDGKDILMYFDKYRSGSSYSESFIKEPNNNTDFTKEIIHSITLEEIFKKYNITKCKLLKMDCEGCEYEVLYKTNPNILSKIEELRMELHISELTLKNYGLVTDFIKLANKYIKKVPEPEIETSHLSKERKKEVLKRLKLEKLKKDL